MIGEIEWSSVACRRKIVIGSHEIICGVSSLDPAGKGKKKEKESVGVRVRTQVF